MNAPLVVRLEGYAACFDVPDLNGDVIRRGAFSKTLRTRTAPVRMLYQHAVDRPIGRWRAFRETARGLYAEGELLLASAAAREVHALLAGGALDGLSIGFRTVRARRAGGTREIREAALWEVSIVTFPMAPGARITALGAPAAAAPSPLALRSDLRAQAQALAPGTDAASPVRASARAPGALSRPGRRASGSPPLDARHFAAALRGAADILSV